MSRIGKKLIAIPSGVEVTISGRTVHVKGPKGELTWEHHAGLALEQQGSDLQVKLVDETMKNGSALWGLTRAYIRNMVDGVSQGFSKTLEISGVGFKVALQGSTLTLNVGFSHPVKYELPKGITAAIEKNTIIISGIDKQSVGQVAAEIRSIKKPEPYKGKGIKYSTEVIRRKVGKVMKSAA